MQNKKIRSWAIFGPGFILVICALIYTITMMRAWNLISGDVPSRKSVSSSFSMLAGPFSDDFNQLIQYLRKINQIPEKNTTLNTNRILWYPLNFGNYILIPQSKENKNSYVGTSFLNDVTGIRDYPGFYNLGTNNDEIQKDLLSGNTSPFCHAIWKNSLNLIVVNEALLDPIYLNRFKSYFTYEVPFDVFSIQRSKEFISTIFGSKIASVGSTYSIFEINSILRSEPIEMFRGNALEEEKKERNWCLSSIPNKLPTMIQRLPNSVNYLISSDLFEDREITIVLAQMTGYRYRLITSENEANKIQSVNYNQDGPKFYIHIIFREPIKGKFQALLKSQSFIEENLKIIILIQTSVIFLTLIILAFSYWRKKGCNK
jgi:hypothetical protein